MPSFWEILFACIVLWTMWEFFRMVEQNEKLNREMEKRDVK